MNPIPTFGFYHFNLFFSLNRPYVMTFCGVNGVGKSTNLAKICFWLVENRCRVLVRPNMS